MTHSFIRNSPCWLEHMALDEKTGGDPPGVKLRAAEGLEAVDYFLPGYHVWAKLIEGLADAGYDANMLVSNAFVCSSEGSGKMAQLAASHTPLESCWCGLASPCMRFSTARCQDRCARRGTECVYAWHSSMDFTPEQPS